MDSLSYNVAALCIALIAVTAGAAVYFLVDLLARWIDARSNRAWIAKFEEESRRMEKRAGR